MIPRRTGDRADAPVALGAVGQGFPQRLGRPAHLRQVRLVLGVRSVQVSAAEDTVLAVINTDEAPAAAAQP